MDSARIVIDGRPIGDGEPPYVIAEMSANHGGDLARAKRIIAIAADQGADAIKFQAYTAAAMTLDCDRPEFVIGADNLWKGRRLYELYQSAATPFEWFPELFREARARGLTAFASPFGADAVAMLERLDAPAYKIASFEAVDLELIAACARTGKPLIISTGLCSEADIADALDAARGNGAAMVALLKCSSVYPAAPADTNLGAIARLRRRFGVPVGYSDHTLGTAAAVAASALGAALIEKHVIDAREPPTADSAFSALPDELGRLVRDCRDAFAAASGAALDLSARERESLVFRRSLYAGADIAAGGALTRANVRCVRPGYGLAPKHLPALLGRRAARAIRRGEPLAWDMVAGEPTGR